MSPFASSPEVPVVGPTIDAPISEELDSVQVLWRVVRRNAPFGRFEGIYSRCLACIDCARNDREVLSVGSQGHILRTAEKLRFTAPDSFDIIGSCHSNQKKLIEQTRQNHF